MDEPIATLNECPDCTGPLEWTVMDHEVPYGPDGAKVVKFSAPVHWCGTCKVQWREARFEDACDRAIYEAEERA